MGWKIYGEDPPEESPLAESLIGFLVGAIGFPTQIGWVLVSLQWIDVRQLMLLSVAVGCMLGMYFYRARKKAEY